MYICTEMYKYMYKYTHNIFFRYSEMQILNEQLISYDQCIYLRNQ